MELPKALSNLSLPTSIQPFIAKAKENYGKSEAPTRDVLIFTAASTAFSCICDGWAKTALKAAAFAAIAGAARWHQTKSDSKTVSASIAGWNLGNATMFWSIPLLGPLATALALIPIAHTYKISQQSDLAVKLQGLLAYIQVQINGLRQADPAGKDA